MKKSILTLTAFIAIILFSGSVQAQTKEKPEKAVVEQSATPAAELFKAEIPSEKKEAILNVLNTAKVTLLKSSNANTTEQNLGLIREMEAVIAFLNEQFKKVVVEEKTKPKN